MQQNHHEQRGWPYDLGGSKPKRPASGADCSMNYCPSLEQPSACHQIWDNRNSPEMEPAGGQLASLRNQQEGSLSREFHEEQHPSVVRANDLHMSRQTLQNSSQLYGNAVPSLGGAGADEERIREHGNTMEARNLGIEGISEETHRQRLSQICEAREALARSTMTDQGPRRDEMLSPSAAGPTTTGSGWSARNSSAPTSQAGPQNWGGGSSIDSGVEPNLQHRSNAPKSSFMNQARTLHPTPQTNPAVTLQKHIKQTMPAPPNVPPGPIQVAQGYQHQNPGLCGASVPPSHLGWKSPNFGLGARSSSNHCFTPSQDSAGSKTFQNQPLQSWDGGHLSKMVYPPMHVDAFGRVPNANIAGGIPVAQSNVILPGSQHQQLMGPHIPNPYFTHFMAGQMPPGPCYPQFVTQAALLSMHLRPQLMVNFQTARSLSMMASEQQLQQQKSFFTMPRVGNPGAPQQMQMLGQTSRIGKLAPHPRKTSMPSKHDQYFAPRKTSESSAPMVANTVGTDPHETTPDMVNGNPAQQSQGQEFRAGTDVDLSEGQAEPSIAERERGLARVLMSRPGSIVETISCKNEKEPQSLDKGYSSETEKLERKGVSADALGTHNYSPVPEDSKEQIGLTDPQIQQDVDIPKGIQFGKGCRKGYIQSCVSQEENDRILDMETRMAILEPAPRDANYYKGPSDPQKRFEISDSPIDSSEGNDPHVRKASGSLAYPQNMDIGQASEYMYGCKMIKVDAECKSLAPPQGTANRSSSSRDLKPDSKKRNMSINPEDVTIHTALTEGPNINAWSHAVNVEIQEQNPMKGAASGEPWTAGRRIQIDKIGSPDNSCNDTDQSGTDDPIPHQEIRGNRRGNGGSDVQLDSMQQVTFEKEYTLRQRAGLGPGRNSGNFPAVYPWNEKLPCVAAMHDWGNAGQCEEYVKTRLCVMGLPSSRRPKAKCPKLALLNLPKDGELLCSVNSTVGSTVVCCLANSDQADDPESLLSSMGNMVPVMVSLDSCVEELQSEIQSTHELNSESTSSLKSPGACSTQVYEVKTPTSDRMLDEPFDDGGGFFKGTAPDDVAVMEGIQYDKKTLHLSPTMDDTQTSKRARVYQANDNHSIPENLPDFTGLVDVPVIDVSEEDVETRNSIPCPSHVQAYDTTVICSVRASKCQGLDTVYMSTPVLQGMRSTVCAVVGFDYSDSAILCWTGVDRLPEDSLFGDQFVNDQLIEIPVEHEPFVN